MYYSYSQGSTVNHVSSCVIIIMYHHDVLCIICRKNIEAHSHMIIIVIQQEYIKSGVVLLTVVKWLKKHICGYSFSFRITQRGNLKTVYTYVSVVQYSMQSDVGVHKLIKCDNCIQNHTTLHHTTCLMPPVSWNKYTISCLHFTDLHGSESCFQLGKALEVRSQNINRAVCVVRIRHKLHSAHISQKFVPTGNIIMRDT